MFFCHFWQFFDVFGLILAEKNQVKIRLPCRAEFAISVIFNDVICVCRIKNANANHSRIANLTGRGSFMNILL